MLFERTLRKKKIPPYYLEPIWSAIYLDLIMVTIVAFIVPLSFNYFWYYFVATTIATVAALLAMFPVISMAFPLIIDRKKNCTSTQDIVITRYDDYPINIPVPETPGWRTLLCFNYTEPFLQIILFTGYPIGTNHTPPMPIKFFIPAVYFTYCFQKDYKAIKEERKRTKAEAKAYDDKNLDLFPGYKKGDSSFTFSIYLTYNKKKELNLLFELVNPPEFRITIYEKSGVFISIAPIPGKEYPPKALECMKKINAMYP